METLKPHQESTTTKLVLSFVASRDKPLAKPNFAESLSQIQKDLPITRAFATAIQSCFRWYIDADIVGHEPEYSIDGFSIIIDRIFIFACDGLNGEDNDTVVTFFCRLPAVNSDNLPDPNHLAVKMLGKYDAGRGSRLSKYIPSRFPYIKETVAAHSYVSSGGMYATEDDVMFSIRCLSMLHAFVIYGGILLSRLELSQMDLNLEANNKAEIQRALLDSKETAAVLIKFQNYFLSFNQSMIPQVSHLVERILKIHKVRERYDDQYRLLQDLSAYLEISYKRSNIVILSTMQIILGAFAFLSLPTGIFFGLFEVSTRSEIVQTPDVILNNVNVLVILGVALFVSFIAIFIIFIIVYLFNREN